MRGCPVPASSHPAWAAEATVSALLRVLGPANADAQKEATRTLRALQREHGPDAAAAAQRKAAVAAPGSAGSDGDGARDGGALTNGVRMAVARRIIGVGCLRARLSYLRKCALAMRDDGEGGDERSEYESMRSESDSDSSSGGSDSRPSSASDSDSEPWLSRSAACRRAYAETLLALYILHEEGVGLGACRGDAAQALASSAGELPCLNSLLSPGWIDALRAASPDAVEWPADPVDRLAARCSLPRWLAARLVAQLGGAEAMRFGEAVNVPGPVTLRFNAAKADAAAGAHSRESLAARLVEEDGLVSAFGPYAPHALSVVEAASGAPPRSIWAIAGWRDGLFEVQDEGSQLIAHACGALRGERVLDMCCGNGGKALALAADVGPEGIVYVHDVKPYRVRALLANARRAGVEERIRPLSPEQLSSGEFGEGRPTCALVDAPCSSSGALRRRPALRWLLEEHYTHRGRIISVLQAELARRAARAVAPGGRLVYATCSIMAVENEEVVRAFEASAEGAAFEAWDFPAGTEGALEGALAHARQMLPHVHHTDGFFMARWRRTGGGA